MSRQDYERSRALANTESFYALLMAAMRNADSDNERALRTMWPETWNELQARYSAPGGLLPGEHGSEPTHMSHGGGVVLPPTEL